MRLALSSRLQKQIKHLPEPVLNDFFVAVDQLLVSFGKPHLHQGLGIRKIHSRGIYEFRIGKQWRVVFTHPEKDILMLHIFGNHNEVQCFLNSW